MSRVIAVVQARLGSSRLPGKVLAEIAGRPMLAHVLERALGIKGVSRVILTTPIKDMGSIALAVGPPVMDEISWQMQYPPDVLRAFRAAALVEEADYLVRITGDCPLLDPELCGKVLKRTISERVYVTNAQESSFGLDCQAFPRDVLEAAHHRAKGSDREHVCPWMERGVFAYQPLPREVAQVHWAVDTQEDLDRVRAIYAHLNTGDFSWQATLKAAEEAGACGSGD